MKALLKSPRGMGRLAVWGLVVLMMVLLAACAGGAGTPTPTPVAQGQGTPNADATPTPDTAYYQGKTIRMVIGFTPGSGADTEGRYIAQRLSNFIPGNPNIIVTTAADQAAYESFLNELYRSPGDGLTVGYGVGGYPDTQLSVPGVTYEWQNFRRVFYLNRPSVQMAHRDVPYPFMQDSIGGSTRVRISELRPAGSVWTILQILQESGVPYEVILGIAGDFATGVTVMERRDVDLRAFSPYLLPRLRPGWIADGLWRPWVVLSSPSIEILPTEEMPVIPADLRNIQDIVREDLREDIATLQSSGAYGVFFDGMITSPETPDSILAVLREAAEQAFADPAFGSGFQEVTGNPPQITRGADAERIAAEYDIEALDALYRQWVPTYVSPLGSR